MTAPAIGFLGAGQMATALAAGWARAGALDPKSSGAVRRDPAKRDFAEATGLRMYAAPAEMLAACPVVVMAVKPQMIGELAPSVRPHLTSRHLLVSVASGVSLATLERHFGSEARLARTMPNTPCLVGASATGVTMGPRATPEDRRLVLELFGAVGKVAEVPEHLLDAVVGVSGSGVAFFYLVIEALADGGVRAGLPRATSLELAAQTCLGAAKMVLETGRHPAQLKDAVTSPGGTTIAGLGVLELAGVRGTFMEAVRAASERAAEQGRQSASGGQ